MNLQKMLHKQKGVASLLTAVMLVIGATLITFLTSKTVLIETKNTADNYRTSQASVAASAAMDRGIAYFIATGFDADGDNAVDYGGNAPAINFICNTAPTGAIFNAATPFSFDNTVANPDDDTVINQTTFSQFYFDNSDSAGVDMKRGTIVARGWSDDCLAMRTISQRVGVVSIMKLGAAPDQSWVSKASVGTNGTGTIINRYTNTNVWAGGDYGGSSAAYDTYIRPSGTEIGDYTQAELDSDDESLNTQEVSNRNSGIGIDVITDDAFLASKTASQLDADLNDPAKNEFFDMYFSETKEGIKDMAKNASGSIPAGTSGLVWFDGDLSLPSLGTATSPVTLIVNGDLTITGGNFYGIIYVTGDIRGTGNPKIFGSIIAEKTNGTHLMSATSTLIFKPWGDGSGAGDPFQPGTGTVIAGSWMDW